MAEKKEAPVKKGLDEWMGTYGDMITLLLCFFVLLYAMSDSDPGAFQSIAASLAQGEPSILDVSGGADGYTTQLGNGILEMPIVEQATEKDAEDYKKSQDELKDMAQSFETYFADNTLSEAIEVTQTENYIELEFKDGILFDVGKAELKVEALDVLSLVADELLKYPNNDIKVEGHADDSPISTVQFPNNFYLSGARSIEVVQFFIEQKGLDPYRVESAAYGEYRPDVPNDSEENRSKNRRVEIKIMSSFDSAVRSMQ